MAGISQSPEELSSAGPEIEKDKPNRISFYVTSDRLPEWDRMHPRTITQLSELLKNKEVQEKLGISLAAGQAQEISEIGFGEDEANALLDLVASINSTAAARIYEVPAEITSQAFQFTPDHRRKITPPLTRVLNKWGPSILKTWKDEIGLGIVFFSVLNAQVRLMHILEEKRKKSQPRATVTEIPQPEKPIAEETLAH